jgi:hypothetical protein
VVSAIFGCPDVESDFGLPAEDELSPLLIPIIPVSTGSFQYTSLYICTISYISGRDTPKKRDFSIPVDLAADVMLRPNRFTALPRIAALCIR